VLSIIVMNLTVLYSDAGMLSLLSFLTYLLTYLHK